MIEPADIPSLRYAEGRLTTVRGEIAVTVDRDAGTLIVSAPEGVEVICKSDLRSKQNANHIRLPLEGAGVLWMPLPQAEAPTEPAGETAVTAQAVTDEMETQFLYANNR